MREKLEQRLRDLESEYQKGQQRLEEMNHEMENLRNTLLRISGAIQVLKEELERDEAQEGQEDTIDH